jgi:DNA-binding LytR/AlgR family response regulator
MKSVCVSIVEDCGADRDALVSALDRFSEGTRSFQIDVYASGSAFLAARKPVDIVFLDIEMPGLDGLQTAHALRTRDNETIVFFVTNFIQCALDGYNVNAAAFIIKPLKYTIFKRNLQRALEMLDRKRTHLMEFSSGRETLFLNTDHITFVETDRKRTLIHTERDPLPCSESLQAVEHKLDDGGFFRIHTSFLINMAFVDTMTSHDVTIDGTTLPVSKHRKQLFLKALADYKGRHL